MQVRDVYLYFRIALQAYVKTSHKDDRRQPSRDAATAQVTFLHSKTPPFVHRDLKSMNAGILRAGHGCEITKSGLPFRVMTHIPSGKPL